MERKGLKIRRGSGRVTAVPGPPQVGGWEQGRVTGCPDDPGQSWFTPATPVYLWANIWTNITNIWKNNAYFYSKRGCFLNNELFDRPGHGTGSYSWKNRCNMEAKDTDLEREIGSREGRWLPLKWVHSLLLGNKSNEGGGQWGEGQSWGRGGVWSSFPSECHREPEVAGPDTW